MKIISEKLKKLPLKPGIYQFIDKKGVILYVGRATLLRRRVESYARAYDPRIQEMVALAKDIKYIQTDSVLEAIILEANLIKKYWPKYNIREKDDRSFLYIVISRKDDFPKPLIVRGRELSAFGAGAKNYFIFGPYQGLNLIKNALRIIRRIFPYSTCLSASDSGIRSHSGHSDAFVVSDRVSRRRPCFNYQIGLCPGACIGAISKKDYWKNINGIVALLSGEKKNLIKKLKKENSEKARSLEKIEEVSLMKNESFFPNFQILDSRFSNRVEGYDISHLTGKETYGSMVVFTNGEPDNEQYRLFKIKSAPANDDLRALAEVLERRFNHSEWQSPDFILIDGGKPQIDFVSKVLEERHINIPFVGISKYGGDKLVFSKKTGKNFRQLVENMKPLLLKVREEAHRFALKASRRKREKRF